VKKQDIGFFLGGGGTMNMRLVIFLIFDCSLCMKEVYNQ